MVSAVSPLHLERPDPNRRRALLSPADASRGPESRSGGPPGGRRSMTDRRKPSWVVWTTIASVCLLVLYPLSFGPACWITSRTGGNDAIPTIYGPFLFVMAKAFPSKEYVLRVTRSGQRRGSR